MIKEKEDSLARLSKIEWFFDGKWNNFVRTFRWPIIVAGVLLAAYAGYRS